MITSFLQKIRENFILNYWLIFLTLVNSFTVEQKNKSNCLVQKIFYKLIKNLVLSGLALIELEKHSDQVLNNFIIFVSV